MRLASARYPEAKIQFANQGAQRWFGISLEEAKGRNSSQLDLISVREDGTEIPFSMRPGPRAIETQESIQNEVIGWRRQDPSEILWTLGSAVPQFGADGSVSAVINTFTNITERKQAEEALHQLPRACCNCRTKSGVASAANSMTAWPKASSQ